MKFFRKLIGEPPEHLFFAIQLVYPEHLMHRLIRSAYVACCLLTGLAIRCVNVFFLSRNVSRNYKIDYSQEREKICLKVIEMKVN